MTFPRTEALLRDIAAEFPSFRLEEKRGQRLQHAIDRALRILTLGGQNKYLTHYHTVLWGVLYVPDGWHYMDDTSRYVLLRHERVHLQQRRRYGDALMTFLYLAPLFPIGLAYGRARIEWEAYEETIAATLEVHGLERARALEDDIVARFTGPDYGWMWPFPRTIRRWFATALADMIASSAETR